MALLTINDREIEVLIDSTDIVAVFDVDTKQRIDQQMIDEVGYEELFQMAKAKELDDYEDARFDMDRYDD